MSEPGSSCPSGLVKYDNIINTSLCWIIVVENITFMKFVILLSSLLMVSTIPRSWSSERISILIPNMFSSLFYQC